MAAVRRTGGGAFDPTDRHLYFSAGGQQYEHHPKHMLVAVNDCMTKTGEDNLQRLIELGHNVLMDSGIFFLTNEHKRATGITMNEALSLAPSEIDGFDALFERYVYLCSTYGDQLWGYIELDQGGRDNKIATRQRLHDLGLSPIPVYHPLNDGWDYFDDLATSYDRLCFGNVVQASQGARVRLMHTMWERHRQYPKLWVHVLGFTASEWCLPCPPDSCDSSSWLNALRYPRCRNEVAMMRQLPELDHRFRYDAGTEDTKRDHNTAAAVYADQITQANNVWRAVLADRPDGVAYPRRRPREGKLEPCT